MERDSVTVELIKETQKYDAIGSYQDSRYVSAPEEVWWLLVYSYVERSSSVFRLDVHLERRHIVSFHERGEEQAQSRERPGKKLTEWF